MFETLVERPVFNLLELIYAVVPGHDLGVAIIIFTIVIRLLLWPLVKKQLHQSKAMQKLQPKLKKIKKEAAGDRQKQARLQMELYKEHGIKPFSTIGMLIVQIPIFIALYQSVSKLIRDPNILQTFSYDWVHDLSWIKSLAADIGGFEHTLFGLVDLSRKGIESGGLYLPAIILALLAAIVQFYQSKMLLPDSKDARKLSQILRESTTGKEADQSEVSAAVGRSMVYFLPFMIFVFAITVPSALALYFLTTSAVGYVQQWFVLGRDAEEMSEIASEGEEKEDNKSTGSEVKRSGKSKSAQRRAAKKKRKKR